MKLDILAIGVHPDDVELGCSGTLINEKKNGKVTGIIDLTQGELGTRVPSKPVMRKPQKQPRSWVFL